MLRSFSNRGRRGPGLIPLASERPPDSQSGAGEGGDDSADLREWLDRRYAPEQQGGAAARDQSGRNPRVAGHDQRSLKGSNRQGQQINREPTDQFVRNVLINGDSIQPAKLWPEQAVDIECLAGNANLAVELFPCRDNRFFIGQSVARLNDPVAATQDHERDVHVVYEMLRRRDVKGAAYREYRPVRTDHRAAFHLEFLDDFLKAPIGGARRGGRRCAAVGVDEVAA